ncbi:hypothetical protein Tco_1003606 [Tanacetum coccineum]|uniref:Uncharacterized protein n=1 Tax=Tanacetum coccineum TaxID=301880 RepID=A0ABQ5F9J7_9ASTR
MILGEYIASAPLSPLVKPGGSIRPIVVGRVWRHLVSKVGAIMIGHSSDGLQFGVGVSGGGEAILHAVNHLIEGRGDDVGLSMLLVDFKNALVDQEAWYLDDDTIVGDTFVGDTLLMTKMVQDGLRYDWSYIAQEEPTEFALMAYTSNSSGSDTEVVVFLLPKTSVREIEKILKGFLWNQSGSGKGKSKEWIKKFPTHVDEMERLIIDRKVTLMDDEGKPLAKVDSLDDHDSEDEVASVDNDMENSLASIRISMALIVY